MNRCRPGLAVLDRIREEQMMPSEAAITAMMAMLGDLAQKLEDDPGTLMPHEAEQLAWILASVRTACRSSSDVDYPDRMPGAGSVDKLIGRGRTRRREKPVPPEMASMIDRCLATLRQQREMWEEPFTSEADEQRRTAAPLPDTATLDRLLRYETHAERSLKRALDTLAKLRGETTVARIRGGMHDDFVTVEIDRGELRIFHSRAKNWPSDDDPFKPVATGFRCHPRRRRP